MKIHLLCMDGSPLGVCLKDLWGEGNRGIGLGGSEYALLTLCEEWHKAHHDVVLYNNPMTPNGSPFEQRNINSFDPNEDRDVLIIFRSPNPRSFSAKGLKVWWSCDQATIGDFRSFAGTVHKIVCISPRHADFFASTYGITNTTVIDLPIRIEDFGDTDGLVRIKNRIIFTSVPDRGLNNLLRIFPLLQRSISNISLAITSDYRLWGCGGAGNEQYRMRWLNVSNVQFFGALQRHRYISELLKAQILLYPSNYDELFCISVAEAECVGVYPITSSTGALPTTNMGTVLDGDANVGGVGRTFVDAVVDMLSNPEKLKKSQDEVKKKAIERFSPKRILEEWQDKIFK
jgi:glycosyltransferase involved in cell wall biosynthesis